MGDFMRYTHLFADDFTSLFQGLRPQFEEFSFLGFMLGNIPHDGDQKRLAFYADNILFGDEPVVESPDFADYRFSRITNINKIVIKRYQTGYMFALHIGECTAENTFC